MVSIAQIKEFIKVAKDIEFKGAKRKEKYEWIETALLRFRYYSLRKKEKSILKRYIMQMTGYSDAQITRLIGKKKKSGRIIADTTKRHRFVRIYTVQDVARLIETDEAHARLSGRATKEIVRREYEVFHKEEYHNIAAISSSHIYNLRSRRQYTSHAKFFVKTRPTQVAIGERCKPDPKGQPGFLRVDTVHQGDLDKEKGVYHINITDEVTQWEVVGCVEKISEFFLNPLLEDILEQFPFRIINFHSDNGSEYINKLVARLLNKLLIHQTKSRARHCNDNALAEGKNGSIVRKHMGYIHIPQSYAPDINKFYKKYFNPYLAYHRPCGFPTLKTDSKGKEKKVYNVYLTPYEALKSHPRGREFLKKGISFEILDVIAYEKSDNECAAQMQKAKDNLFSAMGGSAYGRKNFNQKLQLSTAFVQFISGSYVD